MNNSSHEKRCDLRRLESYLSGECAPQEADTIERHLDNCETCRDAMRAQAAEPGFWKTATLNLDSRDDVVSEAEVTRSVREKPFTLNATNSAQESKEAVASATRRYLENWLDPSDRPESPESSNSLGRLNQYEVLEVVGVGGMGLVMRAFDPSLNRAVAIKTLRQFLTDSESARKRFEREAQIAASLNHPNVIPIYAVDQWRGVPYLVMPLVEQSLNQFVKQRPLTLAETVNVGHQVASGLAAAHAQGMVHRDIKPSNILLLDGLDHVVICDFGLARAMDGEAMTMSGVITGTPQFMSPEQARGEHAKSESDLFSFGCLMYWMFAGVSPFASESAVGSLSRILHEPHQPLDQHHGQSPAWLGSLLDMLLIKEPASRSLNASETASLLNSIKDHLADPTSQAVPAQLLATSNHSMARPRSASRVAVGIAGAICFVLALVATFHGAKMQFSKPTTNAQAAKTERAMKTDRELESENAQSSAPKSPLTKQDQDSAANSAPDVRQADPDHEADPGHEANTDKPLQMIENEKLDALDRVSLLSDLRSGERQEYWLRRLSRCDVDQISGELIDSIQALLQSPDPTLSRLADLVLSKDPFVEVDVNEIKNQLFLID